MTGKNEVALAVELSIYIYSPNRDVRDRRHTHTTMVRLTLKRYHHNGSSTELMRTLSSAVYIIKSYNTYNIVDI